MKVGILVHGRHLETRNWEQLVWGQPPTRLGSLPMMVFVVLNRGLHNIEKIVFGTGASERDGTKESEYMLGLLESNKAHLKEFDPIREHPDFHKQHIRNRLVELFRGIECQQDTRNTAEEIAAAAKTFRRANVAEVIQITCGSHASRCVRDAAVARRQGLILSNQIWSVVPDMTAYSGTWPDDVAVFEPPHRGDDPMMEAPIQAHRVFPKFYRIPAHFDKIAALQDIDSLLEKAIRD